VRLNEPSRPTSLSAGVEQTARIATTPDGRSLCFAEFGDPDGWPVFSLHGTPGCRLLNRRRIENGFEDLLRSLGVRLIRYDRPGYGGSERQPARRVADTAADVATIADTLDIPHFSVEGGSSDSAHALAAAALLGGRVLRLACVAPMAPYEVLGHDEWSRGQDDEVREYVVACLQGEGSVLAAASREDTQMRVARSANDPMEADVFEQTRSGVWGWVDDEVAALGPWGIDAASVTAPTAVWYDPDEQVLPRQHGEWLAREVHGAAVVTTTALGHRAIGDPRPDWTELYTWLVDRKE
jgi:pimeloyl-ACP methyl ester carboxylesterase